MKAIRIKFLIAVVIFYLAFGAFLYRNLLLDSGIWNYGDALFPFNGESLMNHNSLSSTVWWSNEYLGLNTQINGISRTSYVTLLNIGYFIFRDFSTVQFIWWVFVFALGGLSMFLLTYYLFRKKTIAFASSLFYALNPWIISRPAHVLLCQAYAFFPLLFLFYLLLLNEKKFKYAIYFASSAFFVIPSPQLTFLAAALLFLYTLHLLWGQPKWSDRKTSFWNSLKAIISTLALLGFYTLPLLLNFFISGGTVEIVNRFVVGNVGFFYGSDCTVLNVIRLLGFHDSMFKGSFLGSTLSLDPPIGWIFLSFLIPVLWAVPLLKFGSRKAKDIWFFYLLILLGILLSASTTLWNGALFMFFRFLPLSNDPNYYVFILAFAGAILSGVGVGVIIDECRNALNIISPRFLNSKSLMLITCVLVILVVCTISYPLVLWKDYRYQQVQYPTEYYQVADFLNRQSGDFRILLLPSDTSVKHKWAPYSWLSSSDGYLLNKPFFGRVATESTPQASSDFSSMITEALRNNSSQNLAQLLAFANVKYVVVMNDVENQPPYIRLDSGELESYLDALNSQEGITLEKQFGDIYVYKIEDRFFLPHLYSPRNIYSMTGDLSSFINLVKWDTHQSAVIFSSRPDRVIIPIDGLYNVSTSGGIPIDEVNPTTIGDDDPKAFWTLVELGEGNKQVTISNDNTTFKNGNNSLKITVEQGGNYSRWAIVHDYAPAIDWGQQTFVALWWYGANTGSTIQIFAHTIAEKAVWRATFNDDFSGWRKLVFPLSQFTAYMGNPSNWLIERVEVNVLIDSPVATWYLDRVYLDIVKNISMEIDNASIPRTLPVDQNHWFSLGNVTINKGEHNVKIFAERSNGEKVPLNQTSLLFRAHVTAPEVIFEKINDAEYVVNVKVDEPFFLVFSESFDLGWRAYVNIKDSQTNWVQSFFQKSIPDSDHFIVNGYANMWYVDPKNSGVNSNEFSLTIYYFPQNLLYIGCIVSIFTFLCCIGYSTWNERKKLTNLLRCRLYAS